MRIRKWMTLVVAFAMAFTVIGFGLATDEVSAATKTSKITALTPSKATIDVKGKVTVSVKSVYPANASKSVTWKSSNTKIATVSSKGVVTGKKTGKVKITAISKSNKNAKKSITITVKNLKPTSISLPSSITVYTGVNSTVKATVPAKYYNAGVVYKLSNTTYATISPSGKATKGSVTIKPKKSKSSGSAATLTAYSKENSKAKKTCKIYVKKSITSMSFPKSSIEVKTGTVVDNQKAKVNSTDVTVAYTSSNKTVATVDSKGVVTAVAPGTATITAAATKGVKTKASYKITVYDELTPENGTYILDKSKYSRYVVSAESRGVPGTISLNYGDIDNIIGKGNCGFDWTDPADVEDNFADSNFNYASGNDYIFMKEGNEVHIKFADDLMRTIWYYVDTEDVKSFQAVGADGYIITLYSTPNGKDIDEEHKVLSIQLEKTGNTIKAVEAGKSFTMTKVDSRTTQIEVTASGSSAGATFYRVPGGDEYEVTVAPERISAHNVIIKAYK